MASTNTKGEMTRHPETTEGSSYLTDFVFVIGPPGAGKSTLCKRLVAQSGNDTTWFHLSVGDHLRSLITAGCLTDPMMVQNVARSVALPAGEILPLVKDAIEKPMKEDNNIIIDGFPRTLSQVIAFERGCDGAEEVISAVGLPRTVVSLECAKDVAKERYLGRRAGRNDTADIFETRYADFMKQKGAIERYYHNKGALSKVDVSSLEEKTFDKFVMAIWSQWSISRA